MDIYIYIYGKLEQRKVGGRNIDKGTNPWDSLYLLANTRATFKGKRRGRKISFYGFYTLSRNHLFHKCGLPIRTCLYKWRHYSMLDEAGEKAHRHYCLQITLLFELQSLKTCCSLLADFNYLYWDKSLVLYVLWTGKRLMVTVWGQVMKQWAVNVKRTYMISNRRNQNADISFWSVYAKTET